MARLPIPGDDIGQWGYILNDFLGQAHADDGRLKDGAVATTTIADGAVDTSKLSASVQATLQAALTEVVADKQWLVVGPINVAAGDVDYIAPAYISLPAGSTAVITGVRARIHSGTNVQLHVVKNGATVSALGTINATTAGASLSGAAVPLADGDVIAPVVDSTAGSPQNMTFAIIYRITK